MATLPDEVDVVVLGAGHNGLVCAGYLAEAGLQVLVLEARRHVGRTARRVADQQAYRAVGVRLLGGVCMRCEKRSRNDC